MKEKKERESRKKKIEIQNPARGVRETTKGETTSPDISDMTNVARR